jgi:heme/copper-type cytochrome/quinol oxidase subunit 2
MKRRKERNKLMLPNLSHALGTSAAIALILFVILVSIAGVVLMAIIYWRNFAKACYSGVMGLLMFVLIANIVVLCVLAFGQWPIYEELYQLRQRAGVVGGPVVP